MSDKDPNLLSLYRKVWTALKKHLTGEWQDTAEVFKKSIKAEDAAQRIVLAGQLAASKQARQRGREMLRQELLERLIAKGSIEVNEKAGHEIRLKVASTVATPTNTAVGAEPAATSDEATAVPEPTVVISPPASGSTGGGATIQDKEKQLDQLRRKVGNQLDHHLREKMTQAMQHCPTDDFAVVQRCWQAWDELKQLITAEDATERALLAGENDTVDAAVHHGRELLGSEVLQESLDFDDWHTQEENGRVFVRCDLGLMLEGKLQVRNWLEGKGVQSLAALQEQIDEVHASNWAVLYGTRFDNPEVVSIGRELLCSDLVKQMCQDGVVETIQENGVPKIRLVPKSFSIPGESIQPPNPSAGTATDTDSGAGIHQQDQQPVAAVETIVDVEIKIDAEFSTLLPAPTTEELQQLEQNLLADQVCRDPLVLWKGHYILLGGHNRLTICQKHNIPYSIVEIDLPDREAARWWIIMDQLGKRNTPETWAGYWRGKLYNNTKQTHGGDRKGEGSSGHDDHLTTAEQIAQKTGVSEATIRRDGKLAEAVDKIEAKAGPVVKQAILAGHTDVPQKEIPDLAEQEPETIKKTVEERKTGGASRSKGKKPAEEQAPTQEQGKVKFSAITRAIKAMQDAIGELETKTEAFGDHGAKAAKALKTAIQKCEAAIRVVEGG